MATETAVARNHWSFSARVAAYRDSEEAARHIRETGCSEAGLRIILRKGMPLAIRVDAVPLRSAILIKQEAISAGGDAAYSADVAALRCESTDIVLMISPSNAAALIGKLKRQPFGLKKLADAIEALEDPRLARRPLRLRGISLPMGQRSYIMAILNVTPDSFSDGGRHFSEEDAIAHAMAMIDQGADIVDIGGESTRPGSCPVDAAEEIRRVVGPVRYLASNTDAIISVDTTKPEVAESALEAGAHMINDVSGLASGPEIARLCSSCGAGLVLMHMRGTPKDMMQHTHYDDVLKDVLAELAERVQTALGAGVDEACIALDPGFGFSKTPAQNIELLSRLNEFANVGFPVVAGLSRKSTIGHIAGVKDASLRMPGSLAALTAAIMGGADILRVHDVAESLQAAKVADALSRGNWNQTGGTGNA